MDPALTGALNEALEKHLVVKRTAIDTISKELQCCMPKRLLSPTKHASSEARESGPGRCMLQLPMQASRRTTFSGQEDGAAVTTNEANALGLHEIAITQCPDTPEIHDCPLMEQSSSDSIQDIFWAKKQHMVGSEIAIDSCKLTRFTRANCPSAKQLLQRLETKYRLSATGSSSSDSPLRLPCPEPSQFMLDRPLVEAVQGSQTARKASPSCNDISGGNTTSVRRSNTSRPDRQDVTSQPIGKLREPTPRASFSGIAVSDGVLSRMDAHTGKPVTSNSVANINQVIAVSHTSVNRTLKAGNKWENKSSTPASRQSLAGNTLLGIGQSKPTNQITDELAEAFKILHASRKHSENGALFQADLLTPRRRQYFSMSGQESGTYMIVKSDKMDNRKW